MTIVTCILFALKPCIVRRLERRTAILKEGWHLKAHLLYSHFLLAASFFIHAFYSVMPFNIGFALAQSSYVPVLRVAHANRKHSAARAMAFMFSRDITAVFNCLHGIFVFGAATRYLWTRKPLWRNLMIFAYAFFSAQQLTSVIGTYLCSVLR